MAIKGTGVLSPRHVGWGWGVGDGEEKTDTKTRGCVIAQPPCPGPILIVRLTPTKHLLEICIFWWGNTLWILLCFEDITVDALCMYN